MFKKHFPVEAFYTMIPVVLYVSSLEKISLRMASIPILQTYYSVFTVYINTHFVLNSSSCSVVLLLLTFNSGTDNRRKDIQNNCGEHQNRFCNSIRTLLHDLMRSL